MATVKRRWLRDTRITSSLIFGVGLLTLIILVGMFGPMLINPKMARVGAVKPNLPPSAESFFGTDSQGRPIYQTITVQDPPTTEFAGFREYIVTIIVYEKYLKLSARENKEATEGVPPSEIWTVDVTSEGESRDIRKSLPVLVAASIDYIGKDTQGQKTIRIKDTASDIAFVKKGM